MNIKYQIPNFQRAFVWKKENIVSLLDSIWKNYPIGALLALPMSKIHLAHTSLEIKNNFTKNEYNKNNSFYILDGQQRLTSLAIALVAGEMDYKKNNKLAFYFNYV